MRGWIGSVAWLALSVGCRRSCDRPWFQDFDGDGFGDPDVHERACEAPEGFVADARDCDDAESGTHPGAYDACNGVDDDCDGEIDPQGRTWYPDADGDGYGVSDAVLVSCDEPRGFVERPGDCDDQDPRVHPLAVEDCDGVDEDCDGQIDDGAPGTLVWYPDDDGDGWGGEPARFACRAPLGSWVPLAGDCDDTRPDVNPTEPERCNQGRDDDCDGLADNDQLFAGVIGVQAFWLDQDRDGYGAGAPSLRCFVPGDTAFVGNDYDCADADADVHPGARETCSPGDEDCDGQVDEADPDLDDVGGATLRWFDGDGDGFGGPVSGWRCVPGPEWLPANDDCDDGDAAVGPDRWWTRDLDGDGAGAGSVVSGVGCTPPVAGQPNLSAADCDDGDPAVSPWAPDACDDGLDADCSGFERACAVPPSGITRATSRALASRAASGVGVTTGDVDGDGLSDLIVVEPSGASVSFGQAPELPTTFATELVVDGVDLAPAAAVVTIGGGLRRLLLVERSNGQVIRYDLTGRTVAEESRFGASPGVTFGPAGTPPEPLGQVGLLLATSQDVSWLEVHPILGTQRRSWTWAGAGPAVGGGDPDGDLSIDAAAGETSADRVLIFPVGAAGGALDAVATTAIDGPTGSAFGSSLAWVDWDGDGRSDLAVGAPGDDTNGVDAGAVYVFLDPVGAVSSTRADLVVLGSAPDDALGTALAVADLDRDGSPELLASAPGAVVANPGSGVVVAIAPGGLGGADPLSGPWQLYGDAQSHLGSLLLASELDDVDGPDLFLGDDDTIWWLPGAP